MPGKRLELPINHLQGGCFTIKLTRLNKKKINKSIKLTCIQKILISF